MSKRSNTTDDRPAGGSATMNGNGIGGVGGPSDPKRPRLDNGPVAGLPPKPTAMTGSQAAAGGAPPALDLAAVRAQIAARLASLGQAPPPAGPIKAASHTPAPSQPASRAMPPELAARLAAAKEALARRTAAAASAAPANPYLSGGASSKDNTQKAGLGGVMAHPLLSGGPSSSSSAAAAASSGSNGVTKGKSSGRSNKFAPMAPKFSSVAANARLASASQSSTPSSSKSSLLPSVNPYAAPIAPTDDPSLAAEASSASRPSRSLKFNQKGKFIARGEELRKEIKMEELRKRIADAARKAGLEGEFDVLERNVKRQPPPEVEWWDAPLLVNKTYDDLDVPGGEGLLIRNDESLVTLYVQHPIPIPAPEDSKPAESRALMLTKKEQKKMRRQRRAAELQDKRDRQKMGLLPPDPPKVRLSNMMSVLATAAVADPTKIEARVKAEAAARLRKHEEANAARQLTDEQRREKLERKMIKEETRGIVGAAFKIRYLVNGAHRFKIRSNAEQLGLHGLLLFHRDFALVYVEGSSAALKKYKRLMTVRIDWTEEARPKAQEPEGMQDNEQDEDDEEDARPRSWQPVQERPELLADNRCEIVWEGEVPEKSFRSFRYRNVETDREAKEVLGKQREGVWDLSKRWIWEQDE